MNPKYLLLFLSAFILLVFASCSKSTINNNDTETNREQPAHLGGITLDTTWHNDTIIHF